MFHSQKQLSIKEAQNGAEALYLIQRETIDLIVSDLMMPVMDGNELSRRVKLIWLLPHPLSHAHCLGLAKENQLKIGVDEYVQTD